jgi:pimeloyl-ACP methyl ester carboxylesterase
VIIERDGVALNVVAEGRGAPVVLLHGHTFDLRIWDEIVPPLVRDGCRAIRYDQRGHGRSSSPPSGYRWGDHAADLAEVIERLDVAPAHVVGFSKGSGIALEFALRQPELVRSLALAAPLVPDFPLSDELLASFRELAKAIRTQGVQTGLGALWLTHALLAPAAAIPGTRERLEAMVRAFPAGEYLATERDVPDRTWKLIDRLGEVAVPTLVVSGEHDIPDFVAMAALLAERVRDSVLEIVPECGHLVPLERPQAMAGILLRFLGVSGLD